MVIGQNTRTELTPYYELAHKDRGLTCKVLSWDFLVLRGPRERYVR